MKRLIVFLAVLAGISAWAAPEKPVIPSLSISILDYGGVPDGITSNTAAFKKAVDALAKAGGGRLVVPEGVFLSGPIVLKDCMDLHLERGAVIIFSPDKSEFFDGKSVRPGISASKRHDVSISGEGVIDGNGRWWRAVKRSKVSDVEWKDFLKLGGTVSQDGSLWYPFGLKDYPDIAQDARAQERMRTHVVRFTDCTRISVSGVTIQNSPKYHLVPQRCKDVTISGVTVRCPWNAQNGDGIDIMNCTGVLVSHCTVDVGDDGICLKSGTGEKGLADGPCKDIVVEYNTVFRAHGGFVIGSDFAGGMENVVVRHNTFCGTDTGLRFKSAPEKGGKTIGVQISDIQMTDIRDQAIVFETVYANRPAGYEDLQPAQTRNFLPDFSGIVIQRVTCRGASVAILAHGSKETIHDILIKDSVIYADKGLVEDTPGQITLENVKLVTP